MKRATRADPPPALVEFMLERWRHGAPPTPRLPDARTRSARRRRLTRAFPGEHLVIPAGHEKIRANDTVYRFRAGSDYVYLTGAAEPDGVLVLHRGRGGEHREVLFVHENPGRHDPTFFTDRHRGELWVGPRLGVEESQRHLGLGSCRPLSELGAHLRRLPPGRVRVLRGLSEATERLVRQRRQRRDLELASALAELRLEKDPVELKAIERAIAATRRGLDDVLAVLPGARSERELEGAFNARARLDGNDTGYDTIVAAGPHACVLHWTRNDGRLRRGELLLIDAGVEVDTLYTADITRTFPISGRFSRLQRSLYELVLSAHRAAVAAVRPGASFRAPYAAAMEVLAHGLERLGVLASAVEALREDRQLYKRYTLHGVSHMLGLDVHDCAAAPEGRYREGKLAAGMVLTIEPGLYLQTDDLTVPPALRGIGIRIEDDVLVTPSGARVLSAALPREPDEVEAWMAARASGRRR